MNSSPTAADKLRQIEGWCQRLSPAEQLTREQTEWLLREAATAAATVGAAETWLAIAQHDAARAKSGGGPQCVGGIDADVARLATAAPRLTSVSEVSFTEMCSQLQLSRYASQAASEGPPEYALPRGLLVAADNTARDGINQYVANFFSYLTTQEKIETAQEESFRVGHTHNEHVKEVMADRTVSVRGNRVAEECATHPSIDGLGQELNMTIDGMDQAKFKVPRSMT